MFVFFKRHGHDLSFPFKYEITEQIKDIEVSGENGDLPIKYIEQRFF